MIKFALNIKLRYMLRKVLSLLFFIGFLANGNLIAQTNLFTNSTLDGPQSQPFTDWKYYPNSGSPDYNNISTYGPNSWGNLNSTSDAGVNGLNGTVASTGAYLLMDDIKIIGNNSGGNTPPVANNDGNSLDEGEMAIGNVLNNDSDIDGDIIIIISKNFYGLFIYYMILQVSKDK